jgi:hypothetical protein
MQERINRLYGWINCQDNFEVKDIGRQLLGIIEEQEKRINILEGTKNTEDVHIKVCKQMLNYCAMSCEKVKYKTISEIENKLEFFFDKEVIDEAVNQITQ